MLTDNSRWSHTRGNDLVPSRWQATLHPPGEEHFVHEAPPRQRSGVRIQVSCVAAVSLLRSSGRGPRELRLVVLGEPIRR